MTMLIEFERARVEEYHVDFDLVQKCRGVVNQFTDFRIVAAVKAETRLLRLMGEIEKPINANRVWRAQVAHFAIHNNSSEV